MKNILFNDKYSLTQAVIEGRKTMTRRIILNKTRINLEDFSEYQLYDRLNEEYYQKLAIERYSRYAIGEVVAVAQSYKDIIPLLPADENGVLSGNFAWAAFGMSKEPGYNNKMFVRSDLMPYQIRITDINVERLQDISDEDCIKEGIIIDTDRGVLDDNIYMFEVEGKHYCQWHFPNPREAFAALIDKVSGKGTWELNPWVFAYTFKLVK